MIDIVLPSAPFAAYLVVWLVSSLDLFIPILPPGTLLLAGGALAAQGDLNPVLLGAIGALGAWIGDLAGYRLGRRIARGLTRLRFRDGSRAGESRWQGWILRHPFLSLLIARYLPAGRTVAATTAGRLTHPWRAYALAALTAELLWAGPAVLLGYLGGQFIPVGFMLAVALGGIVLTVLAALLRRRRTARRTGPAIPDS
ncbi:DedA family protein [Streptosporangium lutulentum]|uniref:Membrane protein DedA with SNARE-associated domain n=1 Tax=Streptosporangium lutulentum TaxID=1461250 RepID=A0ABT9QHM3_9ACTN|nr:VTT domain-containing protein [Streptosporangium lutulentum]MDP9846248.1 membrane protein DedA with SNARE-associated domain [Streptosporangium lutulentum]